MALTIPAGLLLVGADLPVTAAAYRSLLAELRRNGVSDVGVVSRVEHLRLQAIAAVQEAEPVREVRPPGHAFDAASDIPARSAGDRLVSQSEAATIVGVGPRQLRRIAAAAGVEAAVRRSSCPTLWRVADAERLAEIPHAAGAGGRPMTARNARSFRRPLRLRQHEYRTLLAMFAFMLQQDRAGRRH